jgi:hypothetical protein
MGWCKRRNFVSSGQSQIGGRPIGLKLEGRGRIPSAIPGGGGIEIRSRGFSRVIGRAQMGQSRKACGTEGSNSVSLQRPVGCELGIANGMARQLWGGFLAPNKEPNKPKRPLDTKSLVQIRSRSTGRRRSARSRSSVASSVIFEILVVTLVNSEQVRCPIL